MPASAILGTLELPGAGRKRRAAEALHDTPPALAAGCDPHAASPPTSPRSVRQCGCRDERALRAALALRFQHIVRHELVGIAKRRQWPVRSEAEVVRVLLDNLVGGVWCRVLDRARPPLLQLPLPDMERLLAAAEALLHAEASTVQALHLKSLSWRGRAMLRRAASAEPAPGAAP